MSLSTCDQDDDAVVQMRDVPSRESSEETAAKDKPRPLKLLIDQEVPPVLRRRKGSTVTIKEESRADQILTKKDAAPCSDKANEPLLSTVEPFKPLGMFDIFWMELNRGYSMQQNQDRYTERQRKLYAFFHVPIELEKFLFFGFLQCLDAFCYVFTILPMRCLLTLIGWILRLKSWTPANTCDFLKIFVILVSSYVMTFIDTSRIYHMVRGQGIIKLYFMFNVLEVIDKLFSSFGQDCLDSLMWSAARIRSKLDMLKLIGHLAVATIYAFVHAFLVLLHATTLNVAFNSQSQSLPSILISNNFVELKGSVFKKFAKPNIFQMSCSDVRERFHLMIMLIFVILRNMTANHWRLESFYDLVPDLLTMVVLEVLIDALKHAFITKFNDINFEVYKDFTMTLAFDVAKNHTNEGFSDFADRVSCRMGFIPIPISIMLIRTIGQSIDFTSNRATTFIVAVWLLLLVIKIVNGAFLAMKAHQHIAQYKAWQAEAEYELYRKRMLVSKSKSVPNSPRLSLIDFPDVLTHASKIPTGYTMSDFLPHYDELRELRDRMQGLAVAEEQSPTPRRSVSMLDFGFVPKPREKSLPPAIPENDERVSEEPLDGQFAPANKERTQQSPRRKVASPMTPVPTRECESLEAVQAFELLDSSEPVQDIRS